MSEGAANDVTTVKQDSHTPAPGALSDNPLDAPDAPRADPTPLGDEEMGEGAEELAEADLFCGVVAPLDDERV